MKKIFGYILIICLFAVAIVGVVFSFKYLNLKKNQNNIISGDAAIVKELDKKVAEVKDLKLQLGNKEFEIVDLQNSLNTKKQEIENLNKIHSNELENKETVIASLNSQIENLNNQISELNSQIFNLNTQILELTTILETYAEYTSTTCAVTFFDREENVLSSKVVDKGTLLKDIEVPKFDTPQGYVFAGWSLNRGNKNIIDLNSEVEINTHTAFYAVYYQEFTVNLIVNNEVYQTVKVDDYGTLTLPTNLSNLGDFTFKGWVESENYSVNSTNSELVNNQYGAVSEDKTFVAVYSLNSGNYKCDYLLLEIPELYVSNATSFNEIKNLITVTGSEDFPILNSTINNLTETMKLNIKAEGITAQFIVTKNGSNYICNAYSLTSDFSTSVVFTKIN